MERDDFHEINGFFPSSDNVSKPKETKALPPWKDIQETYTDIFAFDEVRREEAIHRYNIIDALIELHGLEFTKKNIEESTQYLEDKFKPHLPSPSSIYRYWRDFKKSGFKLSSLVPGVTKGNGTSRMTDEVEVFIEQAIKNFFSDEEQTATQAFIELETEIDRHNECHDTELELFSIQSFRRRIKSIPEYEQLVLRKGKAKADAYYRKVGQRPKTTRVLERVEVDHTRLDLFVIDEIHGLPLGRPWLTLLHDNHTKSIIGFYLGFEPPSFLSVSLALENAILPKDYVKSTYPKVNGVWPCYGLPEHLVVDNGSEFNSRDFKIACKELHIKVKKNPTKKPWLKGSVERYFRTINKRLLSGLPGKSFSNIFERKDYDPLRNAVIRHKQLLEMVHVWLIDVYQNGKNGLENNIPNLSWSESMNSSVPPRPYKGTREQLKFNLGKNEVVKLDKNGIRLGTTVRYSSKRLANYWGNNTSGSKSVKVRIKYDPSCLGKIFVLDELNEEFFAVEAVDSDYAYSVSLWLHKVCCRFAREHIRKHYNHQDVVKAWRKIFDIIEEALGKSASVRGKNSIGVRTTTKAQRVTEHAERAKSAGQKRKVAEEKETNTDGIDWSAKVESAGWDVEHVYKGS